MLDKYKLKQLKDVLLCNLRAELKNILVVNNSESTLWDYTLNLGLYSDKQLNADTENIKIKEKLKLKQSEPSEQLKHSLAKQLCNDIWNSKQLSRRQK